MNATLKDVAQRAKVHFTTVSLALRGNPRIPADTRTRIVAIANELGYRRDPIFMALTTRRGNAHLPIATQRMAFLSNHADQTSWLPHMRYFFEGARMQAELMGYCCDLLFVGGNNLSSQTLAARLRKIGCEGVIIGAFELPFATLELDWSHFAAVKIDSRFMEPMVAFVSNDQVNAVRLAYRRLRQMGYCRIGMAVGQYDEEATHDLYAAGYLIEQADLLPRERIPPLHFPYPHRVTEATAQLRAWVREHRVRVIMSNWTHILEMALTAGFRVPDELACVCLCLSDPDPRMAGVIQNHRAVGQKAAEILALVLKTGQRGIPAYPSATYLAGHWQDGASAPNVP